MKTNYVAYTYYSKQKRSHLYRVVNLETKEIIGQGEIFTTGLDELIDLIVKLDKPSEYQIEKVNYIRKIDFDVVGTY
jgi:hypothetical protein